MSAQLWIAADHPRTCFLAAKALSKKLLTARPLTRITSMVPDISAALQAPFQYLLHEKPEATGNLQSDCPDFTPMPLTSRKELKSP